MAKKTKHPKINRDIKNEDTKNITQNVDEIDNQLEETTTTPWEPEIKTENAQKMNPKLITLGVLLLALASIIYYFRSSFIAATVNGEPILRSTLNSKLTKQYGEQTLDLMITEALVRQQAKTKGVVISDDKIASEAAKIESSLQSSGQTLDQVLLMQGMTREELNEQLKLNLMVNELSATEASPSAEDIANYIEENKETLPEELTGDALDKYVLEMLVGQNRSDAVQTFIGNLKQGAKIQMF